jgi:hypothetical protein
VTASLSPSLHEEINARAPRGTDWERDPAWALREVRQIAQERAIRSLLAAISEFFRRPFTSLGTQVFRAAHV